MSTQVETVAEATGEKHGQMTGIAPPVVDKMLVAQLVSDAQAGHRWGERVARSADDDRAGVRARGSDHCSPGVREA